MNTMFDIGYAFRNLIKSASFTVLTVFVMTIGLGACLYIASVVKNYTFDPIHFPDGEQVLKVNRKINDLRRTTLFHDYLKIKEEANSFSQVSAYYTTTAVVADEFKSIRYFGTFVTGDFFALTGIEAVRGRTLNASDLAPGALPVTLLSHFIWQNHFGGDEHIVGKTIRINRNAYEVVGVAAPNTGHPFEDTLWMRMPDDVLNARELASSHRVQLYVRMKPGTTERQAQENVNALFANSPDLLVSPEDRLSADVEPIKQANMGTMIRALNILLVAGICVLVLCCTNVGNLLLARANSRMHETAIRLALGARRTRLIVQLMWEASLVCVAGGLLAIFIAGWALEFTQDFFVNRSVYTGFPRWASLHFGGEEVLLGALVTIIAILLVGFVPAWRATHCDFNEILKDGSKTALGKKAGWISKLLVNIQISLSCILMAVAGVSFVLIQQAINQGYGIPFDNYISGRVNPSSQYYARGSEVIGYFDRLLAEMQAIPGVEKATLIHSMPTNYPGRNLLEAEGVEWQRENALYVNSITAHHTALEVLDIPLLEGRFFDHHDNNDAQKVAIISDTLAQKIWPGESPIGKRIRFHPDKREKPLAWRTVIGVVPHIIYRELFNNGHTPNVYEPYAQNPRDALAVVLKTQGNPARYKDAMEKAALRVDPNIPMYLTLPLTLQAKSVSMFPDLVKTVFAVFAICAFFMAVSGIYGIVANHIKHRTQELGIRRALGIPDSAIQSLMLRQCMQQLVGGLLVGLPLAYVAGESLVAILAGGASGYLWVYLLVPVIIIAAMLLATWVPMMRVLGQSPASALRYE